MKVKNPPTEGVEPENEKKRKQMAAGLEDALPEKKKKQMTAVLKCDSVSSPELSTVANHIGKDWKELGRHLGTSEAKLDSIELERPASIREFGYEVLREWTERTGQTASTDHLRWVLEKIGRKDIAEKIAHPDRRPELLKDDLYSVKKSNTSVKIPAETRSSCNVSSRNEDAIRDEVREKLKSLYATPKRKKAPWNRQGSQSDAFYSDLEMHTNREDEAHFQLEDIFDYVKREPPLRILIEGRPGYGKTTIARKLANDWALGQSYIASKFNLVFLISLKDFDFTSINEALQCLGQQSGVDDDSLLKIITQNHKDVLIILDGYDEMPSEKRECILPLLISELYSTMTVLLTCRTNEFSTNFNYQDSMTGTRAHLSGGFEYWRKKIVINGLNPQQQLTLLRNILTNDEYEKHKEDITKVLNDLKDLLPCPMFLLMLTTLIKDIPVNIKTKTQLFVSFFNMMIGSTLPSQESVDLMQALKKKASRQSGSNDSEVDKIVTVLTNLGKLALSEKKDSITKFSEEEIRKVESDYKVGFLKRLSFLTKHSANYYEVFHHSLIEFLIALHLFTSFKLGDPNSKKTWLQIIGFVRTHYSMVLPFLAGLLQNDSYKLFKALKPFAYEYSACLSYLVPLLLECEISQQLMKSLSPFLPVLWPVPCCHNDNGFASTDTHSKVLQFGIEPGTGKIKILSLKLSYKVTIHSNTVTEINSVEKSGTAAQTLSVPEVHLYIDGPFSKTDIDIPHIECKELKIMLNNFAMSEETWNDFVNFVYTIKAENVSIHIKKNADEWLSRFLKEIFSGRLGNKLSWLTCCLELKRLHVMPMLTGIIKAGHTRGIEVVFENASPCKPGDRELQNLHNCILKSCSSNEINDVWRKEFRELVNSIVESEVTENAHLHDRQKMLRSVQNAQQNTTFIHKKEWKWLRLWSLDLDTLFRNVQEIKVNQLDLFDVQCSEELLKQLKLSEIKCLCIDCAFLCQLSHLHNSCNFKNVEVLDVVLTGKCDWAAVFANLQHFPTISAFALTMPFSDYGIHKLDESFPTEDFTAQLLKLSNVKTLHLYGVHRDAKLVYNIMRALQKKQNEDNHFPLSVLCLQSNSNLEYSSDAGKRPSDFASDFNKLWEQGRAMLEDSSLKCLQIVCLPTPLPDILIHPHAVNPLENIFPCEKSFRIAYDVTGVKDDDPINCKHDYDLFAGYPRFSVKYVGDSRSKSELIQEKVVKVAVW